MSKFEWLTSRTTHIGGQDIPCANDLEVVVDARAGFGQLSGIRPSSRRAMALKRVLWPLLMAKVQLIGTGFILRGIGRWMRQYGDFTDDFLEVGCGAMQLRRYLPEDAWYNAIDLAFSEFQVRLAFRDARRVNLAMASATAIPLPDGRASMVVATEVFEHIPNIDQAVAEVRRVLVRRGKLLCSIPNNYFHKYRVCGENSDHVNKWTFDGFVEFMRARGFGLLARHRIGYWIPLTVRGLTELYLPVTPKEEYYTSSFLYAFEASE